MIIPPVLGVYNENRIEALQVAAEKDLNSSLTKKEQMAIALNLRLGCAPCYAMRSIKLSLILKSSNTQKNLFYFM